MSLFFIYYLFYFGVAPQNPYLSQQQVVRKINEVRSNGCDCGGIKMKPVGPLSWNSTLHQSALDHAKDMYKHNYFSHISKDGKNVGERVDMFGYNWKTVGENIAVGHKSFDEVLAHWIRSDSHCKMLMNPKVNEVAVAKYQNYWVQHFGRQMENVE